LTRKFSLDSSWNRNLHAVYPGEWNNTMEIMCVGDQIIQMFRNQIYS